MLSAITVWPNLSELNLSMKSYSIENCEIGPDGCRWLSKASWHHLKNLNLSKYIVDSDDNVI